MLLSSRFNLRYKPLQKTNLRVQFQKWSFLNKGYNYLWCSWCIRHLAKPIWFVLRHPIHGSRKCIRLNGPISFMDFFWQNGLGEDINFARLQILAKWPRAPYFAGRNVPPSGHATTLGSLWGRLRIICFVRNFRKLSKTVKTCLEWSKLVQNGQNLFKIIKTCSK